MNQFHFKSTDQLNMTFSIILHQILSCSSLVRTYYRKRKSTYTYIGKLMDVLKKHIWDTHQKYLEKEYADLDTIVFLKNNRANLEKWQTERNTNWEIHPSPLKVASRFKSVQSLMFSCYLSMQVHRHADPYHLEANLKVV